MPPYLRIDVYSLVPHHISEHTVERLCRPLELDHLARELVDPARHAGITPEDFRLYLLDIVLETVDYGFVVVNDTVHYGVQDRLGPTAQVLGVGLQLLAYSTQVRRLAVAHAHHEVFSHQEVDFAELDSLLLVQVTGRLVEADPRHTAPVSDGLIGLLESDRPGGTVAVHVDGVVHYHSRIIRLCLLLLVHLTRPYYCAPLLVRLALEDGERGALGIAKDGDLAGGEIQGPGQHGTAKLTRLLHGGVTRGDCEVREPEGRRVARHRHEAAVLVASVLDRGVDDSSIVLDRFALPTEESAVEIARRLGIVGLELVPAHTANVVDPSRADVRPRLPDAEHRAGGVGEHGQAAEPGHVEGVLEDPGAQALRPCGGLFGARGGNVVVPVRGLLVLLVDRTHHVAVAHRVDAAWDLIVPELPAKQLTVEGLRALRVRGRKIDPTERSRLVRLPLAHRFFSLSGYIGSPRKPHQKSTGTPSIPNRQTQKVELDCPKSGLPSRRERYNASTSKG